MARRPRENGVVVLVNVAGIVNDSVDVAAFGRVLIDVNSAWPRLR